jgi:secondary thiamine-phosphate synthase enzyme
MIEIETKKSIEVVDITSQVQKIIEESTLEGGLCLVYTLHTTTGITINEAESGLIQDILNLLSTLVPQGTGYLHDRTDGNAHAHLQAVLLGNSTAVAFDRRRLILGTWQRILFLELDGPRRKVLVKNYLTNKEVEY